ncbi:hypothetical protein MYX78_12195, partial [Acidobacteria bacterium AH-259-G07]|nr:hypothetical protein [Acidobacteria bacterium AH-259-G07]
MPKVICVHEYVLKAGVDPEQFEKAIQEAQQRGLLRLPGLVEYHFGKGVKGSRNGHHAAIWVYESVEAWEKLWGAPEEPLDQENYLDNWKIWENEILAPFLDRDPDKI